MLKNGMRNVRGRGAGRGAPPLAFGSVAWNGARSPEASRARPHRRRSGVPRAPLPVCGAGDPFFRTLRAMIPLLRLTHIGICVSDMERSLRFYRDLLGFRSEHELRVAGEPSDTLLRLAGVDLHAVYLQRDGVRIELLHFAAPPGPAPRSPYAAPAIRFSGPFAR